LTENCARSTVSQPWVALFDLDGTLTWRDTLLPFLVGFLGRRPYRALGLWRLPFALGSYWQDRDRGALKSRVIRMIMGGERRAVIDAWADAFVNNLKPKQRLRPLALAVVEAHRAAGDRLVLMSASPDLYVRSSAGCWDSSEPSAPRLSGTETGSMGILRRPIAAARRNCAA